jgi:hypothetical protein
VPVPGDNPGGYRRKKSPSAACRIYDGARVPIDTRDRRHMEKAAS